ncbi:MAG: bifunctional metallophosphatase/5'-nucleotidase [Muribaculaceae bacterium]|nr:bifunctional metallophosphatase/5'-nucleotidase [Muribaculaceae bacterium]
MRKAILSIMLSAAMTALGTMTASAEHLVILHTNDTHSQIDPENHDLGGVMRRKALIDSVRGAEKNVLLVDAGDVVQGTLYFNLYRGEVEHKVMNALQYDIATLGNHEFDNGAEELAGLLRNDNATWVSTNYDVENSPLAGLLVPYVIKEYDGKKVGIMALNLDPKGMISDRNVKGIEYMDVYEAADHTAWALRHNEKADVVVALTHIGYSDDKRANDSILATVSKDIDLIIGGHSHTPLNPANPASKPTRVKNAGGKEVVLAQLHSMGTSIGKIDIDLDNNDIVSSVIPVDSRLDGKIDKNLLAILAPYRQKVDSLMSLKLAKSAAPLDKQSIINIFSDIVMQRGGQLIDGKVDMAILNNGGIRHTLPKGDISEGHVMMVLPFNNTVEVVRIKGESLARVLAQMGRRPMNGVSGNVDVIYNPELNECTSIVINGRPLDPDKYYNVATIDYLAEGGDYLAAFKEGEVIATSGNILSRDISNALKKIKKPLKVDTTERLHR